MICDARFIDLSTIKRLLYDLLERFSSNKERKALWSVITIKYLPHRSFSKYSIERTTAIRPSSFALYRSSQEFRNQDVNAIGFHPSTPNCSSAVPKPEREASHFTSISSFGLQRLFSVAIAMRFFISEKQFSCTSVQINLDDFYNSSRSGWLTCARLGINLLIRCTEPRKESFVSVFGASRVKIAEFSIAEGRNTRLWNMISKPINF